MKRSSSSRRRWLVPLVLFLLTFLPTLWIYHGLFSRLPLPVEGYRLEIARGASFVSVIDRMADDGVIPDRWLARAIRYNHRIAKVQANSPKKTSPKSQ